MGGGGAAGLRAAIAAAEAGRSLRIVVVSKVYPMRSHTVSAEGGTAAVLRDYDSYDMHGFDTVKRTAFAADKVGFHLLHTLFQTSLKYENIERLDEWFVTQILTEGGKVVGVVALDLRSGTIHAIAAKAVVITTGGAGRRPAVPTTRAGKNGGG